MDLVSIITPLYNAEKFIQETAESIFAQSYPHWEWIVVNDCSSDASSEIIEKYATLDPRIKLIKNEKNLKTAQTRNRGIAQAKGKYIAFIDSDDIWHPEKLSKQIEFMKRTGSSFSYHAYRKFRGSVDNTGNLITVPDELSYTDLLKSNQIACLSAVYDAETIGKFDMPDGYKAREDYLCWLNILKTIPAAHGINECLGYYRVLPNSYSSNKLEVAKLQWRVYREVEKLNVAQSAIYFLFYSCLGFIKSKE